MKKQYSVPKLINHGNVEAITQFLGSSDKNDFLFFNGSAVSSSTSTPITGDGSEDGIFDNGNITPKGTLQGK